MPPCPCIKTSCSFFFCKFPCHWFGQGLLFCSLCSMSALFSSSSLSLGHAAWQCLFFLLFTCTFILCVPIVWVLHVTASFISLKRCLASSSFRACVIPSRLNSSHPYRICSESAPRMHSSLQPISVSTHVCSLCWHTFSHIMLCYRCQERPLSFFIVLCIMTNTPNRISVCLPFLFIFLYTNMAQS